MLEEAGLTIRRHDDLFDQRTPDAEWLAHVARRGWISVTGDQRIIRQPLARAAIQRLRATVLVLVGNHAPTAELAQNLVNTWPTIERRLAETEPPVCIKVYRPSPKSLVAEGKPGRVQVQRLSD